MSYGYRYFLAFLPGHVLRRQLEQLCDRAGQIDSRIKTSHFHLTLAVIAELEHRDRFMARRVDAAFSEGLPSSCPVRLGKVRGGMGGAAIYASGRQHEVQDFYAQLLRLVAQVGLHPLHRKSGLKPHVTLGYDQCAFEAFNAPMEWVPDELVLIESEVGRGIHNLLHRWPLRLPPQGWLPFEGGLELPDKRWAAGG